MSEGLVTAGAVHHNVVKEIVGRRSVDVSDNDFAVDVSRLQCDASD